jgi:hypothetical protein
MSEVQITIGNQNDTQIISASLQETQIVSAVVGVQGPMGPSGLTGAAGSGVPSGGTTDQVLLKLSNADYDTTWGTVRELTIPPFDNVSLVYSGGLLAAAVYPSGGFYDYVSLTYSGNSLLQTDYISGGSGGTTVATYVLAYSGNTVTGINRTL